MYRSCLDSSLFSVQNNIIFIVNFYSLYPGFIFHEFNGLLGTNALLAVINLVPACSLCLLSSLVS
jgi:hypothetical protein